MKLPRFEARLDVIHLILSIVDFDPVRWTPLVKRIIKDTTPWVANTSIYWLLRNGYLIRPKRGVYALSDSGVNLLRALDARSQSGE